MEKTSWEGTLTKAFQRAHPEIKGFYTRYINRHDKTGLEIVVPKDTHLEIYSASGVHIRNEVKYHHYNSDEVTATARYKKAVLKPYQAYIKAHKSRNLNLRRKK